MTLNSQLDAIEVPNTKMIVFVLLYLNPSPFIFSGKKVRGLAPFSSVPDCPNNKAISDNGSICHCTRAAGCHLLCPRVNQNIMQCPGSFWSRKLEAHTVWCEDAACTNSQQVKGRGREQAPQGLSDWSDVLNEPCTKMIKENF